MTLWIPMKTISLALPQELLFDIDEAAKRGYMSRSEYIRFALQHAVTEQQRKDKPTFYDLDDS